MKNAVLLAGLFLSFSSYSYDNVECMEDKCFVDTESGTIVVPESRIDKNSPKTDGYYSMQMPQNFIDPINMEFKQCNEKGNPIYTDIPSKLEFEMIDSTCVNKAKKGGTCRFGHGFDLSLQYVSHGASVWLDENSGLEFTVENPCDFE